MLLLELLRPSGDHHTFPTKTELTREVRKKSCVSSKLLILVTISSCFALIFSYTPWQGGGKKGGPNDTRYPLTLTGSDAKLISIAKTLNSDIQSYFNLEQSDAKLQEFMRKYFLIPPSWAPYNLTHLLGNPTKDQPQYLIALKLLGYKKNGTFLEAGANDGESLSNTLILERDYGWTGLLVEPDATAFGKLKGKNRKSWIANACVSTKRHMIQVSFRESNVSVMSKVVDPDEDMGPGTEKTVVKTCVPLIALTAPINLTVIDFMSLDMEGVDLAVLETIPFDKLRVRVLCIEYNKKLWPQSHYERLRSLLHANDFIFVAKIVAPYSHDYIFAHKSVMDNYCGSHHCNYPD